MDASIFEYYQDACNSYDNACKELGRMMAFENPSSSAIEHQVLFIKECFSRVQELYIDLAAYTEEIENDRN